MNQLPITCLRTPEGNRLIVPLTWVLSLLATASALHAGTYTWTGASSTSWNTSAANWSGEGSTWINGAHDAVFSGTAAAVRATENLTAHKIFANTPGASGYNITTSVGASLTLTGEGAGIDVSPSSSLSIGLTLAGSDGLTKTGTGSVTLNAPCTYTGATTVAGGVIGLSGSNLLPAATALYLADSCSVLLRFGNSQQIASLAGSGNFSVSGGRHRRLPADQRQ